MSFVSSWWIFDPGRARVSYAEGPNAEARSIHTLAGCGRRLAVVRQRHGLPAARGGELGVAVAGHSLETGIFATSAIDVIWACGTATSTW